MELKDCTKEELITIIKRLSFSDTGWLKSILSDIEYERMRKKIQEAENWGKVAGAARDRYIEIVKECQEGGNYSARLLKEAQQCLKDAEMAERKEAKLMKEINSYVK